MNVPTFTTTLNRIASSSLSICERFGGNVCGKVNVSNTTILVRIWIYVHFHTENEVKMKKTFQNIANKNTFRPQQKNTPKIGCIWDIIRYRYPMKEQYQTLDTTDLSDQLVRHELLHHHLSFSWLIVFSMILRLKIWVVADGIVLQLFLTPARYTFLLTPIRCYRNHSQSWSMKQLQHWPRMICRL